MTDRASLYWKRLTRTKLSPTDTPQALGLKNYDFRDTRIPCIEAARVMRDNSDAHDYFLLDSEDDTNEDLIHLQIMTTVGIPQQTLSNTCYS